jgi:predicted transcriptional regulator
MRLTRARIHELLAGKPDGLTAIEIAKALDAKRCTVAAALNKLVDCGRIVRKSPPSTMIPYRYRLKPAAEAMA